jgi:YidC/Oxa1 family membrane protein insertase
MNPLDILEEPLKRILEFFHESVNLTYGWSIVALTVLVRLVLLPLVIKQYRSMRQMAVYAPQIKELQAKYKGNRQKQQEEMMKFYKENSINPFASCLPLVAQLPVFIALYYVLKHSFQPGKLDGSPLDFMWVIPNVTENLREIGWGAAVIVVIYGLSQLLSTELSATPNMPNTQRMIMRFIPLAVVGFIFTYSFPVGLVIYWMTTNLWTCGQQLVMRHMIGHHPALAPTAARAPAAASGRSSRTPPATATAAVAVAEGGGGEDGEPEAPAKPTPARTTPRRRRRGTRVAGQDGAGPAAAPSPSPAPEPAEAPEAAEAAEAAEHQEAPEPAPEPAPERPSSGASANGAGSGAGARRKGGGGQKRRPRPKGQGTSSGQRRPPKKRR